MMSRERDTGVRLDALVRGAEWARTGTNDSGVIATLESVEQEKELHPPI